MKRANCVYDGYTNLSPEIELKRIYPEMPVNIVIVDDRRALDGNVHFCKLVREIAGVQFVGDLRHDGRFDPFVLQCLPSEVRRGVHEEGMLLEFPGVARSTAQPLSRILDEQTNDEIPHGVAQVTRLRRRIVLQYPLRDFLLGVLALQREGRRAGQ